VVEQCFDDQFERFGVVELIDEHPPETHVPRSCPRFVPGIKRPCHEVCGNFDFLRNEPIHSFHRIGCELIPPPREPSQHRGKDFFHVGIVDRR
jgi:hypothetical protein